MSIAAIHVGVTFLCAGLVFRTHAHAASVSRVCFGIYDALSVPALLFRRIAHSPVVARYWGPPGGNPTTGLQTGYRGEPVPHELGHFLLSGINNGGSPDPEHTPQTGAYVGRLMYPSISGFTGVTTTTERGNVWTNTGFSPWIDHF